MKHSISQLGRLFLYSQVVCACQLAAAQSSSVPNAQPAVRQSTIPGPAWRGALTLVGAVVVSSRGETVITQPEEGCLRVFDRSGKLIETFGRKGGGPGEFEGISYIGFRGDTLWVADPILNRITLFNRQWKLLRTLSTSVVLEERAASGAGLWSRLVATSYLRNGGILLVDRTPARGRRLAGSTQVAILGPHDTLPREIGYLDLTRGMVEFSSGDNIGVYRNPYGQNDLIATAPDGSYLALVSFAEQGNDPSEYSVRLLGADGRATFDRRFPKGRSTLSASDLDRAADSVIRESRLLSNLPDDAKRAYRRALTGTRYVPSVNALVVTTAGRVWLKTQGERALDIWTVLSPRGMVERLITLPADPRRRVLFADDVGFWALEPASGTDEPILVRYTIRSSPVR